jgi:uncharacterized protein YjbJ (UPF0337 family)
MDREHAKGLIDNLVGKTKEAAGHATGNKKLEIEGKVQQVEGAIHAVAGDAKEAARGLVDRVKTHTDKA